MLLHSNCGNLQNILKISSQRGWTSPFRFDVIAPSSAGALFIMENRVCKKCGKTKPLEDFVTDRRNLTGKAYYCKSCANNYAKELYKKRKPKNIPIPSLPEEVWKDVKGFEGVYQISNLGRVKSCARATPCRGTIRHIPEKLLYISSNPKFDYPQTHFWNKERGRSTHKIHRLVAEAFIPNPEDKCCVNHINGIKTDYRVENLEWVTYSENAQHAYETGLWTGTAEHLKPYNIGEANKTAILNEGLVKEFRRLHAEGMKVVDISNKFPNIQYKTIYAVIKRYSWKHIA